MGPTYSSFRYGIAREFNADAQCAGARNQFRWEMIYWAMVASRRKVPKSNHDAGDSRESLEALQFLLVLLQKATGIGYLLRKFFASFADIDLDSAFSKPLGFSPTSPRRCTA